MAEDNPIEGLDPNQSAFEPMLDMMNQETPEDLSRTTTTTTLYISGDQTQIDQPRVSTTTTMAPVETLDIVSQFRQSNPEVKLGDVNKVIPNASYEERMQLLFDYPDQFGADIEYNNKINSYVTQLKDQGYKDDQILSYLEQQKEGKKSDLMTNFPDLFDVKSIKRKDNIIKALESDKISYSKLLKFGSESKLKNEYPEFANLIDQKKKNEKIQKEIKAKNKKIDANIEAEKQAIERQLETGKNFIGQDMSPIDQEAARKRLREIEGEQTLADLDAGDPFQGDTSRADIGKISYKRKPVTGFEFERINEFNVEPIVKDYRFVDQDQVKQELELLNQLNINIRATGGKSLSDEQIREVYVDGTKPFNENYKDYDDKLWKTVSGIVSTQPVVDLNDEFFERHDTTREEFINKRKLILSSGLFNTQKLGDTYYTEEEFQAMYNRASEKLINKYGSTIGTYEKITGTNLRENPEQFYDEARKSSSLYMSDIDEDIVIGDSEQTSKNLRERFGFLPYGSRDESQNYLETEGFRFSYDGDNLVIQSTITPEGKNTPELLNGIEINMNGSDPSAKIKNFMSKAIVTDEIRDVINEYSRGEGRFQEEFDNPMRASIDFSNYILSKPYVFGDANGFATDGYGQGFLFGLIPMGPDNKSKFMRNMSVINTQVNALKAKDPISNQYLINNLNKNIQYAQYVEDQKAPELTSLTLAAAAGLTETISGITEGVVDLIIDIPFAPVSNTLSEDEVNMLKESGLEEYQILDIQNKRIKDEVEYGIDEWINNTTAVTDKSIADAGLTYELIKTMIHSISTGAIVGFNPSLVPVAFGLQTTARVENELKDSGLSNFEKRVISWPMATFEGILENFGLQTALSPGKSMLFKWVANKALKGLPKNASLHAIEASMKYTMKGLGTRTMLGILEGGSFEALTEVGQEAVEFTEKNTVNMLLGKDVFKNMPDITTEKGANQFLNQLGKAALLGGLSGGGISAIGGTTNLLVNGFKLKGLNKSFENQYDVITSEEGRAIALSQINLAYQSKQITKEEANARIKAMNDAYPLMMEIPAELSSGQKRQAYDLMLERKALEAEVKDKDKNLVVKQTERIAEINNQLQQISKTDAVQEQETKEEVLPDEQSEMGLQDVGQGDTQGEEASKVQQELDLQEVTVTGKKPTEVQQEQLVESVDDQGRSAKPGARLFNDPNPETSDISAKYKKEKGIETTAGEKITELDTNKSMEIADAYEAMENNPNDPEVKEAYESLAKETIDQYKAMTDAGYEIEIYEGKGEPYANSQEMIDDLINNKHMYIFSTEQGYGEAGITDQQRQENAMLAETEFVDKNGKPLLINDLFRGVHDFFGHSERGNGFGAKGEENAWDVHARMFTDKARRAMTAETRGQNSWVNFGPQMRDSNGNLLKKGDPGHKSARERDFAPQKIGLLPEQYSEITDTPTTEVTKEVVEDITPEVAENIKNIEKQVDNAKKAISKIIPGVEIITHKDEDSYRKATGETDSKEQTSRGEYNPKTKKIHINLSKANNRTVAHEVFHAILLDKVKTNKATRDFTERMIKSLLKSDQLENIKITYRGEEITLAEYLEKFASNYDENIQSEEKLAELVGILAENYGQLSKTNKSLIKRFLDRLAKMFGLKPFTDNEVVDVLNAIAGKVAFGQEISEIDVKVISEGASTFIAEPTTIEPRKSIGKKVVASNKPSELSFVTKKDLIDIESLVKEIADKKQKVWFWVADQMGRGMYSDVVVDGQHFLDAGPSYALDPVNKSKDIIWATGKDQSEIEKLIDKSDFIFIISGSPISSKLFNKKNIDILEKRIGDYSKFKKDLLKSKPTKPIKDILNKHNSWKSLKESPDRKKLLIAFENQKDKNTETKKVLGKYNAFIDFNSLRDGFYKENDFKMNEVMLVLKPTAYGGKSNHSTYENDILGEVIGVPDTKVDSFDLMPEAVRKKYSETLGASQKAQVVAPYGIGVKEIESPAKRKQIVIGENANLKQNVKDFLLQANEMESKGQSREEIRLLTGWERGADNKWGYELNDVIDIDVKNIKTDKVYNIEEIVSFPSLFDAYGDAKKLKIKFINNSLKSGMAAYLPKRGLIEVNLSKIGLSEYIEGMMAQSRLSKDDKVLNAAVLDARLLKKENELESKNVRRNSDTWIKETESVYPSSQRIINKKLIDEYKNKNNVSAIEYFNDIKSIQSLIDKRTDIDTAKGLDELNSKVLHEIQHAVSDLAGFPMGGSAQTITKTFTSKEKNEYNDIVKNIIETKKLLEEGKATQKQLDDAKHEEAEYRYKKYDELAGETMSRNVEKRRKLSPQERREKTLESTMDVDIKDQKLLYEDEKNISIKEKKVESKQKPKEKKGLLGIFRKRKQKDDGPVEPKIDIRNLKKKSDKKIKETNKGKGPILRRLRRGLFDRQNDIKRVIKDFVPNPKKVSKIINRIVTKAGASGYANELFTQQDKKIFGKLKADQIENLELIIYARRIVAINENRRDRGMNPYKGMDGLDEQAALQNLEKFEQDLGKKEFDALSERADEYFEAFKNNLKMLRDSGRITEEIYENLKDVEYSPIKTLKYIIPQDTMTDEDINNAVSTLGVNKKDIMKLSDMNENEILFDARFLLMMNTNIVVRRSFENEMLNEFAQGYESIDKAGKEALSDFIIEGPVKKVPPGFRKVEYFQDGVKKEMVMKEDYARQLLDIKNQNNFLKGLGKISGANILRFFATGGNPLFIVGNTAVDFANIAFFSDVYSSIKPLATVQLAYDFVKNFLRKTGNTNNYNKIKMEFMEHGGAMDFLSTDGLRMVQDMKLKNRILNKAQKGLAAYARFMSYVGETGEMSFRLAVYERVKKAEIKKFEKENDRSPNQQEMEDIMFEAAAQSRETIDFSQGGTWVKQMDQALPYFNAAMQGLRRPLDFARKNPVGFTSNVVQYAVMAAGMTATSLGTLLRAIGDDEEEKKKVQDTLDSVSMYEKANYHIIFTGNKDKDGNYQYVRIKKLPLLSILGTATEQYTTKYLLKSQGIDYKTDDKAIKKSIEMSAPLDVLGPVMGDESVGQALGGIVKRNPLASAWLTYTYNEDTFTGDKVFYEPKDKKIKPYAEGLYDNRVNDIYKVVAPALDMSPKRAQAAVEKIVTSESTNPSISIFYALTNGLFDTEADAFKENSDTFDNGMGHFLDVVSKKMVRHTNPNLLRYKNKDRLEDLEKSIDTDAYLTKIKIKKDINKNVDSEVLRNGDYNSKEYKKELKKLEDILDKNDVNTKDRPYYGSYTVRKDLKGQEMFKEMTDIIYERSPKMMAARLYSRYGDSLDDQELKELSQSFKLAKVGNKILKEGYQIYYKKNYLKKSQEEIDKFEKTFGKIR